MTRRLDLSLSPLFPFTTENRGVSAATFSGPTSAASLAVGFMDTQYETPDYDALRLAPRRRGTIRRPAAAGW